MFNDTLEITNNGRIEEIYIRPSVALYQLVNGFLVQSGLGAILESCMRRYSDVVAHLIRFQELTEIIFDDGSFNLKITDIVRYGFGSYNIVQIVTFAEVYFN